MYFEKTTVTVAKNGTSSAAFSIVQPAKFIGAIFPDMDAGDVGLEFSPDAGTTYYPLVNVDTGIDAVLIKSGSDPGCVDFTKLVGFIPDNSDYLLRFTCASQTTAAVTISIIMQG